MLNKSFQSEYKTLKRKHKKKEIFFLEAYFEALKKGLNEGESNLLEKIMDSLKKTKSLSKEEMFFRGIDLIERSFNDPLKYKANTIVALDIAKGELSNYNS